MHPHTVTGNTLFHAPHEQEAGETRACPGVHVIRRAVHELANALTIVQTHAQRLALLDGANGPVSSCAQDFARATLYASTVLSNLRQALHGGSPAPAPRESVVPVDLLLEAWRAIGPSSRNHVTLELALQPTPLILASRQPLSQALINLLLNALAAVRPGDRLRLATSSTDGWVDLSVSDTGPGMPPEVLARCFEEGFTTKRTGSGLGLAIVKSTVDAHSGTLLIDSEPGRGTTVTMRFPVAVDQTGPAASPPASLTAASCLCPPQQILVLHRHEAMHALLCELLQAMGHQATGLSVLRSPHECEEVHDIHTEAIDACTLLITDQLDEGLRRRRPNLPIIYITSNPDITTADGATILQMPFNPHTLRQAIRTACAGRRHAPAVPIPLRQEDIDAANMVLDEHFGHLMAHNGKDAAHDAPH